jgi:hypothetical protein
VPASRRPASATERAPPCPGPRTRSPGSRAPQIGLGGLCVRSFPVEHAAEDQEHRDEDGYPKNADRGTKDAAEAKAHALSLRRRRRPSSPVPPSTNVKRRRLGGDAADGRETACFWRLGIRTDAGLLHIVDEF